MKNNKEKVWKIKKNKILSASVLWIPKNEKLLYYTEKILCILLNFKVYVSKVLSSENMISFFII